MATAKSFPKSTKPSTPKAAKPRTRRGSGTLQFLTQEELKRLFAVITNKRDKVRFLLAYRHGLPALPYRCIPLSVHLEPGNATGSADPLVRDGHLWQESGPAAGEAEIPRPQTFNCHAPARRAGGAQVRAGLGGTQKHPEHHQVRPAHQPPSR